MCFGKLKHVYPIHEDTERTKEHTNFFKISIGEELPKLFLKSDFILFIYVIEKFSKVSTIEFDINPLHCVSLPRFTWLCGMKDPAINLQTTQDKELFLLSEKIMRGQFSSVMGDRYVKSDENKKFCT